MNSSYLWKYKSEFRGTLYTCGTMVIIIGNGHNKQSSNPALGCENFILH